jgi:hypothetical protein
MVLVDACDNVSPKQEGCNRMPTIPIRDLRIGDVAGVQSGNSPNCYGLNIESQQGTPWITIVYRTKTEAEAAWKAVEEALRNAVEAVKPD